MMMLMSKIIMMVLLKILSYHKIIPCCCQNTDQKIEVHATDDDADNDDFDDDELDDDTNVDSGDDPPRAQSRRQESTQLQMTLSSMPWLAAMLKITQA